MLLVPQNSLMDPNPEISENKDIRKEFTPSDSEYVKLDLEFLKQYLKTK